MSNPSKSKGKLASLLAKLKGDDKAAEAADAIEAIESVDLGEVDDVGVPEAAAVAPQTVARRFAAVNWERRPIVPPTPEQTGRPEPAVGPELLSVRARFSAVNWDRREVPAGGEASEERATGKNAPATGAPEKDKSVDAFFADVQW